MEGLPQDVEALLLRALGAYMRAAPSLELPTTVRRLQNFRQRSLVAHKAQVLGLLEEDTTRALILQWLDDDRPSLPKKEEQALRTAARREDGWPAQLASLSGMSAAATSGARGEAPGGTRALEAERAKVSEARREIRAAKEQARRSLDAERARSRKLENDLARVRHELAEAKKQAAAAQEQAARVSEQRERDLRKARREVDAARGKEEESRRALSAARKELRGLERRVGELEKQLTKRREPARRRPPKEQQPMRTRAPLAVPKGRLADDPETLDAWLDAPGVQLLVDGYNVTKAEGGYGDLALEVQRDRLLESLEKLAVRKGVPTRVVFDGAEVARGISRRSKRRVQVEYSRAGETADDHLVARLEELPPDPVVVVTNDRELQERARQHGATVAASSQLLELLRA